MIFLLSHILANSTDLSLAAFIPYINNSLIPEASKELRAAYVVPPGDVTFFFSSDAVSSEHESKFAAPKRVCFARRRESSSLKPNC